MSPGPSSEELRLPCWPPEDSPPQALPSGTPVGTKVGACRPGSCPPTPSPCGDRTLAAVSPAAELCTGSEIGDEVGGRVLALSPPSCPRPHTPPGEEKQDSGIPPVTPLSHRGTSFNPMTSPQPVPCHSPSPVTAPSVTASSPVTARPLSQPVSRHSPIGDEGFSR